jgi:hypothetical protein
VSHRSTSTPPTRPQALRCSLAGATGVTILYVQGAAAGGTDDLTIDIQQATAYTGGTSGDLDSSATTGATGITEWYVKSETTLDNDESWVKVTQTEASEVTLTGATYATKQCTVAVYVAADQLADGYGWISVNLACTTSNARLVAVYYILHDLAAQRTPANLPNLLRPGAANV